MRGLDAQAIGNEIADPATHANPRAYHALLTRLRAEAPIFWAEPEGYTPFWIVTRHADIRQIELEVDVFKNAPRTLLRKSAADEQIKQVMGGDRFSLIISQTWMAKSTGIIAS